MSLSETLLLAWSTLIFWVLGQIWLVQIVVYPLFAKVGGAEYVDYHAYYSSRIPLPVILPGFASFILPVALVFFGPAVPAWMSVANVLAGVVGLLVTVLLEIPRHARLQKGGKKRRPHRRVDLLQLATHARDLGSSRRHSGNACSRLPRGMIASLVLFVPCGFRH